MNKFKVVFFGTPEFAASILELLLLEEHLHVVLCVSKMDSPGDRGKLTQSAVKKLSDERNIPCLQPASLKDGRVAQSIASLNPDFIVVAAYGKILGLDILKIAPCLNVHASILPKYRGASPIQAAILADEKYSGVSIMQMDEGLDTGDVLANVELNILGKKASTLSQEMAQIGAKALIEVLYTYDDIKPIAQNDANASYCSLIKKRDGCISLEEDAKDVHLKFLAYDTWPGLYFARGTKLIDCERLVDIARINKIADRAKSLTLPGQILDIGEDDFVLAFGKGALCIKSIQAPGRRACSGSAYLNGRRLGVGQLLDNL